jgi:hypothetical protein
MAWYDWLQGPATYGLRRATGGTGGDFSGGVGEFLTGTDPSTKRYNIFNQQQRNLLGQTAGAASSGLSNIGQMQGLPKNLNFPQLPPAPQLNYDFPGYQEGQGEVPQYNPYQANIPDYQKYQGQTPGYSPFQGQTPGYNPLAQLYQQQQGSPSAPYENLAKLNYQTQTVPTLNERFTSMGGGGGRSSAHLGAQETAKSRHEQELEALRAHYGMQERQQTFAERSQQNAQQLERDRLLNELGFRTNEQGLSRENLINALGLNINQQQLAREQAQVGRGFGLNQQQLAREQAMNQRGLSLREQQLQREQLKNQLVFGTNAQKLAAQNQLASQRLGLGELRTKRFGIKSDQALRAQQQQLATLFQLLQTGLTPSYNTVTYPGQPGLLQQFGQAAAQAAPYVAAAFI